MPLVSEESRWEVARNKISQLGSVPASFSSLIRKLRADAQAEPPKISSVALYELNRLLKGPSLLSPLAHASLEFHPEIPLDHKNLAKSVIEALSIEELSSLIGALYLTRQVKKRCAEEDWKFVSEMLVTYTTMAGHLGVLIKPFGFERSLSTVVFTILGMALFQSTHPKQFSTYRRHLKKANTYFDTNLEIELFGCSSREMCSLLSQAVAISSALASEFLQGLEAEPNQRPSSSIQAINIWIASLAKKGTAPQVAMDSKWFPAKEKVSEIEAMVQRLKRGDSEPASWIIKEAFQLQTIKLLLRGQDKDIEPEVTPEILEDVEPFSDEES